MPARLRLRRAGGLAALALLFSVAAPAADTLPPSVRQALAHGAVPAHALSAWVQEVGAPTPRLRWQAAAPRNPASLFKLVTTSAALDLLGPAYAWPTPVWLHGTVRDGVLEGDLVIQGRGDPKLVLERVWLLLRRVRQLGVREIRGDIVLDRSAFSVPAADPGAFDGERQRPYNVGPDALLLNYKAVIYSFTPEPARGVARVSAEPPLDGVAVDAQVPLAAGDCDAFDWRGALKASFADPRAVHFAGSYRASCGERQWPVADAEPASYNARLLKVLWRELGGELRGTVRDGAAPAEAPSFVLQSPPLADVLRDINKFSNNVMAQQLFLTLGLLQQGSGTPEAARAVLQQWLAERLGPMAEGTVIDNGSGLSRDTRVTAELLARVLQLDYAGAAMPELMSSLPVLGVDGTAQRLHSAPGRAHLKTGSLRDVAGVAGYVLADSGRRYVVVALVNHPFDKPGQAEAARAAIDALLQWASADR